MTIRKQPSDFVVREVLAEAVLRGVSAERGRLRCALYELRKSALTTPEAVRGLARALGVRERDISYAGLKDKHAQTVQHVTAMLGAKAGAPRNAGGKGWSAILAGWVERPLAAAAIGRNEFTIVVRDLSPAGAAEMERRAVRLLCAGEGTAERRLLIVNYFGDQRFGSARHGGGFAARHLVRREFEAALRLAIATPARKDTGVRRRFTRGAARGWGDWAGLSGSLPACPERRAVERLAAGAGFDEAFGALPGFSRSMIVEAYQSHLWNEMARRIVGPLGDGMVAAEDPFGPMLFPAPGAVPDDLRRSVVPLLAPDIAPGPWDRAAGEVLRAEGITLGDMRLPDSVAVFFGSAERSLFVEASGFELGPATPDELAASSSRLKRLVRFALPRGAYATVVLRALGQ